MVAGGRTSEAVNSASSFVSCECIYYSLLS